MPNDLETQSIQSQNDQCPHIQQISRKFPTCLSLPYNVDSAGMPRILEHLQEARHRTTLFSTFGYIKPRHHLEKIDGQGIPVPNKSLIQELRKQCTSYLFDRLLLERIYSRERQRSHHSLVSQHLTTVYSP